MKNNIVLIGFMGTGKTAVGQVLAGRLHRQLIEVDALIEKMAGKTIPDIFRNDGEIYFRELEIAAVKQAAAGEKQVIACGGGVVLNTINIERLRAAGVIINLTAAPRVILKRTAVAGGSRPLLNVAQPLARINELKKFRQPFYDRAADITINTSKLSVETVAGKIINGLKEYAGFNL
jgi:shikimate kinase